MTHNVISFDSVSQIKDFVSDVENHNIQVRYGNYELKDNSGQLLESGSMNGNARIGQWTQYYYDQNVKIYITYQSGVQSSEEYKTMEGIPYSGKFEYIDEKNHIKEVRNVKDGLRHGKTILYNTTTGKVIEKVSYKKGVKKE